MSSVFCGFAVVGGVGRVSTGNVIEIFYATGWQIINLGRARRYGRFSRTYICDFISITEACTVCFHV